MPLSVYPRENELLKVKEVYQNTSATYLGVVIRKVNTGEIIERFGQEVETVADKDLIVRYATWLIWRIRQQVKQEQLELRYVVKE